jgi:hypothetical protein
MQIVPEDDWIHGEAQGDGERLSLYNVQLLVGVRERAAMPTLRGLLLNAYVHALLYFNVDDDAERSKRELKTEAAAHIVTRYFGFDMSGSAFYLTARASDDPKIGPERFDRIRRTTA